MHRILLVVLLTGCAGARYRHVETATRPVAEEVGRVAVAPAVLLQEAPGILEEGPFRDGLFVGNLVFSGGFVTEQHEVGLQNVSKQIDEEAVDLYTGQVRDVTDALLGEALERRGVGWTRLDGLDPALLLTPRKLRERGTYPEAGRDNQNLPRFALEPRPLPADALAAVPDGHDTLLVPWVVHYYTHNAGWFVGQTWGCAAGARYRVLVAAYDAGTGAPLGWTDVSSSYRHERLFQPNSGELEDFLMALERVVGRALRRKVLR